MVLVVYQLLYYALLQIVITICNPPSLTAGRHCVPLSASFIRPLPKPLCGFGGCCAACKAQRVVLCNRGQYITQMISYLNNQIVQLQTLLVFLWNSIVPDICAEDISTDCSGGITVAVVINGSPQCHVKVVLIPQSTVNGNSKCFLGYPAFTELMYS